MINRWKELDGLPCVKHFGIKHKIAHFIGMAHMSLCLTIYFDEGIRKGIFKEIDYTTFIRRTNK